MERCRVKVHVRKLPPIVIASHLVSVSIMRGIFSWLEGWGVVVLISSLWLVEKLVIHTFAHPRPCKLQWLSERDELVTRKVTSDEVTNRFLFLHMGQKVVYKPLSPREVSKDQNKMRIEREEERKIKRKKEEEVNKAKIERMKGKEKRKLVRNGGEKDPLGKRKPLIAITTNLLLNVSPSFMSLHVGFEELFEEFMDVFPKDMPHKVPPLRGIENHIDLTLEATLPDRAAYRTNPEEGDTNSNLVRESMSPCAMLLILVPKKDDTWRICIDCRPINNITIRYKHHIPIWMICYMNYMVRKYFLNLYEWLIMPFDLTNAPKHFYEINEPCLEKLYW
ncbi:hypothetical protein CR513_38628, partial [Mucuna pruriens]